MSEFHCKLRDYTIETVYDDIKRRICIYHKNQISCTFHHNACNIPYTIFAFPDDDSCVIMVFWYAWPWKYS